MFGTAIGYNSTLLPTPPICYLTTRSLFARSRLPLFWYLRSALKLYLCLYNAIFGPACLAFPTKVRKDFGAEPRKKKIYINTIWVSFRCERARENLCEACWT